MSWITTLSQAFRELETCLTFGSLLDVKSFKCSAMERWNAVRLVGMDCFDPVSGPSIFSGSASSEIIRRISQPSDDVTW